MAYTATCKCGDVVFKMEGEPQFGPNCCCNDCVASLYYVDGKAKGANVENISNAQQGNHQNVVNAVWKKSAITCVKGYDKIVYYKLRPKSTTLRTYTSCCYTTVICCAGKGFGGLSGIAFPFNRNTVSPKFPENVVFRCNAVEVLKPEFLPKDGIESYASAPLWAVFSLIWMKMTDGKPNLDAKLGMRFSTVNMKVLLR